MQLSKLSPFILLFSGKLAYNTSSLQSLEKSIHKIDFGPKGIVVYLDGIYSLSYQPLTIEEYELKTIKKGIIISKETLKATPGLITSENQDKTKNLELIISQSTFLKKELNINGAYKITIRNPIITNHNSINPENQKEMELLDFSYIREVPQKTNRSVKFSLYKNLSNAY